MACRFRLLSIVLSLVILTGTAGGALAQGTPASDGNTYAHPEWFAEVGWLQEHLGDDGLTVVALTPAEDFAAGHIP
ncbi:MAG: hypothetical protein M3Y37_01960, partial [Chloroflexota bacterium]|nr:hypothetical protein [Chloroflexota bacterium]